MTLHFQTQIDKLKKLILSLGTHVEESVDNAIRALDSRDVDLALQVMESDHTIDALEVEVEEECLKILSLYQPVANDLRFLVAVLKMNNDLERMGDHAANIAKRAYYLARREPVAWPIPISWLGDLVKSMVKNSLDALVNYDADLARQVCADDDSVDAEKRKIIGRIREVIRAKPEQTEIWLKMLDVPRHLERIADLSTNIAEDVVFLVEGHIHRHRRQPNKQSVNSE